MLTSLLQPAFVGLPFKPLEVLSRPKCLELSAVMTARTLSANMQKHEDLRIWVLVILSLSSPRSHFGGFEIA